MWKGECSKDKLKFHHHRPEDFTLCLWLKSTRVRVMWIIYRFIISAYFVVTILMVFSTVHNYYHDTFWKNFIFFTYWSYIVETTALFLAFVVCLEKKIKDGKALMPPPMEKMPTHYKVLWIAYVTAAPCSVVVSILFWLFVFEAGGDVPLVYTLITHFFNSALFFLDFLLVAIPYRVLHIYVPIIFSFVYGIFSIIYQVSGGTGLDGQIPIYKILDWRHPGSALLACLIEIVCLSLVHCALALTHTLKVWLMKASDSEPV